ncbi:hypothetical protein [Metamycoplasma neophronis]|uniref:DUF4064 domain-containing protein n=1 Tax=Metamycoplasma neophronis TaxID=872983 RepID=A0ABY2Z0X0_9BACT|nr:hypothetical protein [Metamycoplasma neophronis]TPR54347.1 hypothetical protein FJR74_01055 [Metamycoplasma neophronis]
MKTELKKFNQVMIAQIILAIFGIAMFAFFVYGFASVAIINNSIAGAHNISDASKIREAATEAEKSSLDYANLIFFVAIILWTISLASSLIIGITSAVLNWREQNVKGFILSLAGALVSRTCLIISSIQSMIYARRISAM